MTVSDGELYGLGLLDMDPTKKPNSRDGRVHPYTGRPTANYSLAGKTPLWYPSPSLESGLRYYFCVRRLPSVGLVP